MGVILLPLALTLTSFLAYFSLQLNVSHRRFHAKTQRRKENLSLFFAPLRLCVRRFLLASPAALSTESARMTTRGIKHGSVLRRPRRGLLLLSIFLALHLCAAVPVVRGQDAEAQRLFSEGQQLLAQGTVTSQRAAVEKFEAAVPLWRAAGDKRHEAISLSYLGKIYDQLGDGAKALGYYQQTLSLVRAVGDRASEAAALNNIGLIYYSLGDRQKALSYYDDALATLRSLGDKRVEAITLVNIALAFDSLGEKQKALDHYNRALPLLLEVGDRASQGVTLNNMGFVYDQLGEKEKALDYYGRALPVLREVGNARFEATTLNNIGYVYDSLDEKEKALEYYNLALPVLRAVGDRRVEATTLNNIGLVYKSRGERQKALDFFRQALQLRRAIADRDGEAITLNDTGSLYDLTGNAPEALEYYRQALQLSRAVQDKGLEAAILLGMAKAERSRGHLVEARKQIESALALVESLRTKVVSQELRASYFASVQEYFETYVNLLMRQHRLDPVAGYDRMALEASERARARSLLESLTEAGADIRQGVDPALLERERSLRSLLNAKAEQQTRLLNSNHTEEQAAGVKKELDEILTRFEEVETQLRTNSPRYAALAQPAPLSLKEIQTRVLDADTLLLEYALGAEKSYLWAVTPDSIHSYELPPRAEIEDAARRVYELLTARNKQVKFETADERRLRIAKADEGYAEAAGLLSRMVLAPVAAQVGRKRLMIVSDGALQYIPFAALPAPENPGLPLVVNHEIVSEPSASTVDVLRRELAGRKAAAKTLAILADPVFEKSDERVKPRKTGLHHAPRPDGEELKIGRLPFTRREASEIAALVPESERLVALDFAASRETATSDVLAQYRYVHFATHGFLNSAHPELSGIVLSLVDERGAERDGFLRAYEIYNLKLPAEVVVLSGCRTGLGKEIKGEGLVGLTRGFMYAGSARVLVSLWDIADEASAELMTKFYRELLGRERPRPAAALRAAQLAVRQNKRWQAPYYWAAFALQGEAR
jgi:CHAT domain-containing protein/Flp pilus assembly protein TadD